MEITIQKMDSITMSQLAISNWPIWEKEKSDFEWDYDDEEHFYVISGKAIIKIGQTEHKIGPGDYVICTKGISCHWRVIEPIKKHYQFKTG